MSEFLAHFRMHSRFRNGVFILATVMVISLLLLYLVSEYIVPENHLEVVPEYQVAIEKLGVQEALEKEAYRTKPFNPNFMSEYKAYVLGVPLVALERLYAFRKQDKWVNSAMEFQQVTGVSDSLLAKLQPFFKFPSWKNKNSQVKKSVALPSKTLAQKADLNTVKAMEIQEVAQLSEVLALRIIKYRERIGGFVDDIQLQDVYGIYQKQRDKILSLYTVKTPVTVARISVNAATVADLVTVPYFDFEMALAIKDFIRTHGEVTSFSEFDKIEGFPMTKIKRISLYLKI